MSHDLFNTRQTFTTGTGEDGSYYSLPQLENAGLGNISRLPISIRIVLESVHHAALKIAVVTLETPWTLLRVFEFAVDANRHCR